MKKFLFILLLLPAAVFITCKDEDPKDCAKATCSEQFNKIYMTVKGTNDLPVALDTFKLVNMLDKSDIKLNFTADEFAAMKTSGNYLLIDDSLVPGHQNSQLVVEFSAILGGKVVGKNSVTISADCCHVGFYYGSTTMAISGN